MASEYSPYDEILCFYSLIIIISFEFETIYELSLLYIKLLGFLISETAYISCHLNT